MEKIIKTLLALSIFCTTSISYSQNIPTICPVKEENAILDRDFGMGMDPLYKIEMFHSGVDIKSPEGTPILATANGVVEMTADSLKGYGKHLYWAGLERMLNELAQRTDSGIAQDKLVLI